MSVDTHVDPPFFPGEQRLLHGGDWNPDQWLDQPAVLDEDLRLMAAARCRTFSLGVFSWTALQPDPGRFTMDWMAEVLDRLHQAGGQALLATPSGAQPA